MKILKIFKNIISEARLDADVNSMAFFKIDYFYVLYDFKKNQIIGAMNISCHNDFCDVGKSAALKGFGPLLYDSVMMDIYPKPLSPDRDGNLSGDAYNIWEYYATKRKGDVIMKDIPESYPFYNEDEEEKEQVPDGSQNMRIKAFNVFYYLKPNEVFHKLKDNVKFVNIDDKLEFIDEVDNFIEEML